MYLRLAILVGEVFVSLKPDDCADDWIAENAKSGDIVITADIPLAQRCLENDCLVLGPTGREFDPANIGMAIAMRDLNQHLRETGASKGYNRAFSPKDRSQFLGSLEMAVRTAKKTLI